MVRNLKSERAVVAAELTISHIKNLALEVALSKIEAHVFGGRKLPNHDQTISAAGGTIQIKPYIKYLGLTLDQE